MNMNMNMNMNRRTDQLRRDLCKCKKIVSIMHISLLPLFSLSRQKTGHSQNAGRRGMHDSCRNIKEFLGRNGDLFGDNNDVIAILILIPRHAERFRSTRDNSAARGAIPRHAG